LSQDAGAKEARCEVCGAPLEQPGQPCPRCGNSDDIPELAPLEAAADAASTSPPRPAKPRRRWPRTVAIILGFLAFLTLAGALGVYSGLRERRAQRAKEADALYQRGMNSLLAGDYALAVAAFEQVERLQPGYRDTAAQLAKARQALLSQPTPTSQAREDIAANLLARAQDQMEKEAWSDAIATLQDLQKLAPTYKPEQVKALLGQSMYSAGLLAVKNNDLVAALEWFKQAQAYMPGNADLERQISLANSYVAAMADWGLDWPATIESLTQLYRSAPDYADVRDSLATAHMRYADELSADGQWCPAAEQYRLSLSLKASQTVETKKALADEYCRAPYVTPTPGASGVAGAIGTLPAATPGLVALPGGGRLYFAMAGSDGSIGIYTLSSGQGQKPTLLIADADQPAIRDDGSIAYRDLIPSRLGISMALPDGSFAARVTHYAEDSWPTWEAGNGRLAFASTRESDRKWRVYVADNWASGKAATFLAYGRSPAWAPNGVIAYRGCDQSGNNCGIYLARADGALIGPATDNPQDDMPAWSPDSSKLAFTSPRSGNWNIWIKDLSDGRLTRLTDGPQDISPAWSPDGKYIAFISSYGGSWGIWVVSADGGAPQLVWKLGTLPRSWDQVRLAWR